MHRIIELIKLDFFRLQVLQVVASLQLPECYVAAGFVRNLVWDHVHAKTSSTPLNDIDVVYFDLYEHDDKYLVHEKKLKCLMPVVNWQVRNQAYMHLKNQTTPYTSTLDALSFWPEKETAVGIRLTKSGQYELISTFELQLLFDFGITFNPKSKREIFTQRIQSKSWLQLWPKLSVRYDT